MMLARVARASRALASRALAARTVPSLGAWGARGVAAAPKGSEEDVDPFVLYLRRYRALLTEMASIDPPMKKEEVPAFADKMEVILKKLNLPMDAGLGQLTEHFNRVSKGAKTARQRFDLVDKERRRLNIGDNTDFAKIGEAVARAEKIVGGDVFVDNNAHMDILDKEMAISAEQIPGSIMAPKSEAWFREARIAQITETMERTNELFRAKDLHVPPEFEYLRDQFPWSLFLPEKDPKETPHKK